MPDRTVGNYVLGPLLGRGGMSEVYAAEHRFLGDQVAVKLLRSHLAGDPGAIAGFIAEATRTRAIAHPGVVRVIDFGSDGDDCYLVMERLDGESLAARLERERRLGEAEVRRLGAAIADGVAAAHDRGIVHRDLKPGNIMLVGDAVKIVDFGIARTFGGGAASVTSSRIGSIGYMAPEQITEGLIAPCIDVWALGVILYEALSGQLPFVEFANGRTPQLFEQPPPLATLAAVSPALEGVVMACLARSPARRPASMRELAGQLRDLHDPRFTEPLGPATTDERVIASDERRAPIDEHRAVREPSPDPAPPLGGRRGRGWALAALVAVIAVVAAWTIATRDTTLPDPVAAGPQPSPPAAAASPPAASPPAASPPAASPPAATGSPPAAATATTAPSPPASFTVDVRSAPPGASVLLGGKRVGVTPTTLALDAPTSLVVTRAGYQPSRIRAERGGAITVRLVRARRARAPGPVAGETLD